MTTLQAFGYLSAIINISAVFPYIYDILKGKTHPQRASWFIWATLGTIAFFSQMEKGATNSLWLSGASVIGALTVFILSIKYGTGGFVKRDKISLLVAALGLLLWFFTKEATYALFITILINSIGSYLTIVKSYKDPDSETVSTWILGSLSGIFAIISVGQLNFVLLIFPFYMFLANLIAVIAILLGKRHTK